MIRPSPINGQSSSLHLSGLQIMLAFSLALYMLRWLETARAALPIKHQPRHNDTTSSVTHACLGHACCSLGSFTARSMFEDLSTLALREWLAVPWLESWRELYCEKTAPRPPRTTFQISADMLRQWFML